MSRLEEAERAHAAALNRLAEVVADLCDAVQPGHERRCETAALFVELGLDEPVVDRIENGGRK